MRKESESATGISMNTISFWMSSRNPGLEANLTTWKSLSPESIIESSVILAAADSSWIYKNHSTRATLRILTCNVVGYPTRTIHHGSSSKSIGCEGSSAPLLPDFSLEIEVLRNSMPDIEFVIDFFDLDWLSKSMYSLRPIPVNLNTSAAVKFGSWSYDFSASRCARSILR